METTIPIPETTDPQPDLGSFDAYEAKRIAPPEAETEKPAAGTEEEKPETSEKLETTEGSEQQVGKPKKDRTADARFAEFTFAHKQRMAQIEKERDEWRQKAEAQGQTQQPQADKKPESAAGKPLLKDFVAALKADETYEDAQERWNDAVQDWREVKAAERSKEQQQSQAHQERQARIQEKVAKAHEKYQDFGELMTRTYPNVLDAAFKEFIEEFDDLGAIHAVLSDPAEIQRISQLSKARQLVELGKIDDRLSKPEPKPTAPHVSKAPAPLRNLGGSSSEGNDDLNEAKTFEEFERLRAKQRKK